MRVRQKKWALLVQALVTAIFLIFIAMAIQFESPNVLADDYDYHSSQPDRRL